MRPTPYPHEFNWDLCIPFDAEISADEAIASLAHHLHLGKDELSRKLPGLATHKGGLKLFRRYASNLVGLKPAHVSLYKAVPWIYQIDLDSGKIKDMTNEVNNMVAFHIRWNRDQVHPLLANDRSYQRSTKKPGLDYYDNRRDRFATYQGLFGQFDQIDE